MITVNGIPFIDVKGLILVVVYTIVVYGGIIYVLKKKNYKFFFAFGIACIVYALGLIVFRLATDRFSWSTVGLFLAALICTYIDVRNNDIKEKIKIFKNQKLPLCKGALWFLAIKRIERLYAYTR